MSDISLGDALALFNAVDDVLDVFGVKEEKNMAREVVRAHVEALVLDNQRMDILFRRLAYLRDAASVVRGAPVTIGQSSRKGK